MNLKEYSKEYGIDHVMNDYDEIRYTTSHHIIFANGWCASIVKPTDYDYHGKLSVAMCDYNGWFDWQILDELGAKGGCFLCETEDDVIEACEIIRSLNSPEDFYKARNSKKN